MSELDQIPLLCRRALEARMTPRRMQLRLVAVRESLAHRRQGLEDLGRSWAHRSLTRAEFQALRRALGEGQRELEELEACLDHLQSWSAGGGAGYLRRALVAFDEAQRSWKRHFQLVLTLAPEMSCRESCG